MKKVLFIAAAAFIMSAVASAQVPTPVSLYVGGAISLPSGPEEFSDAYKTGFHATVGVGLKAMPNMQIVGKVEYHRFALDFDQDPLMAGEDISGGNNNMMMFGADARYSLGLPAAPVKPFFLGGFGIAHISMSEFDGSSTLVTGLNDIQPDAQNKLYYNIGAGVELKTGPAWSLFGQLRYVSVATEGKSSSFVPITLGLKFF
jgi:opacity protein-like surface antigen